MPTEVLRVIQRKFEAEKQGLLKHCWPVLLVPVLCGVFQVVLALKSPAFEEAIIAMGIQEQEQGTGPVAYTPGFTLLLAGQQ